MKLQDRMLRAMFQAAKILAISCRQMQRWQTRFKLQGYVSRELRPGNGSVYRMIQYGDPIRGTAFSPTCFSEMGIKI